MKTKLFALAAGVLAVAAAALYVDNARAQAERADGASASRSSVSDFLTTVTKDVDKYWTKRFADAGLSEPRVAYNWIPAGATAACPCWRDRPGAAFRTADAAGAGHARRRRDRRLPPHP